MRTIFWDIETSLNVLASFGLYEESVPHTNILQERHILCASWVYDDEKRVHTVRREEDGEDTNVCLALQKALADADVAVAHYGNKFDMPYLQTRCAFNGLGPVAPIKQIDTCLQAKQIFRFNANRLDYLGGYLGLGSKMKIPGSLWLDILKGDKKALRTMQRYNQKDVTLLRSVYKALRPWLKVPTDRAHCPACGSASAQRRGWNFTATHKYARLQCTKCATWYSDKSVKVKFR